MGEGERPLTRLAVGEPYPGAVGRIEHVQYNWRQGGHELLMVLRGLTSKEKNGIRRGPAEFALAVHGPVIFFLYRFGVGKEGIPWSDCPYTYHMLAVDQRGLPPELEPEQGVILTTILVSAETGIVESLRAMSLSPHFSRALHDAIRLQAERPFDQHTYDQALSGLYARYPSTDALLATAIARTHGGD